MAQDVHDGVGHSLAVIAMQAGVAAHVLDRDPARARELMATVAATSREALDGLRADLERMRSPADEAARRPGAGPGRPAAAAGPDARRRAAAVGDAARATPRCRRTSAPSRTGSCRSR